MRITRLEKEPCMGKYKITNPAKLANNPSAK